MPDTLKQQDSLVRIEAVEQSINDTIDTTIADTGAVKNRPQPDTADKANTTPVPQQKAITKTNAVEQVQKSQSDTFEKPKDTLQTLYDVDADQSFINNIPVRKIRPVQNLFNKSYLGQHQEITIREIPRNQKTRNIHTNWFSILLYIAVILCYIWLQFFNKKYIYDFIRSTFNFQLGQKIFRDRNILIKRILFILNLIFYLIFAQFIIQALNHFYVPVHTSQVLSFIIVLAGLFGLIQIKRLVLHLTGKLFLTDTILQEYAFNSHLVNKTYGLVLLPITILITYLELNIDHILIIAGITLLLLATLLKYMKGLKIILRHNVKSYHIILYLCTLEILPILIGIRFFVYIS